MKIDRPLVTSDLRAESPVWDPASASLFQVDIASPKVRRLHPASGEQKTWPTPSLMRSIGLAQADRLRVQMERLEAVIFNVRATSIRSIKHYLRCAPQVPAGTGGTSAEHPLAAAYYERYSKEASEA